MNFHKAKYVASYGTIEQLPESKRCEIAFAGRSNVGKSSLMNALMYRKNLAKVSSKPGKTATINFFDVDGVDFVDLPGYGFAKVSASELDRWADLIEGYFNDERDLRLAVCLVDIRHDPSELDHSMIDFVKQTELPFAVVLTKADKLSKQKCISQKSKIVKQLNVSQDVPILLTSTEKNQGIEELRRLIEEKISR
jgi:GTP-binding protein